MTNSYLTYMAISALIVLSMQGQVQGECVGVDGHSLICHTKANCSNIEGSDVCQCNPGYTGDGVNCTDIDECGIGTHSCSTNATCSNYNGTFACLCDPGYKGDGETCTNLDECASLTHNCHFEAMCIDNLGGYSCQCNTGFSGNGSTCWDIDHCAAGSHVCHYDANCTDGIESYQCYCRPGFTGNGTTCNDVNECDYSTSLCHTDAMCSNNNGSYQCSCNVGFSGDGRSCFACPPGTYGLGCKTCSCLNNATCDPINGSCSCAEKFSGTNCETAVVEEEWTSAFCQPGRCGTGDCVDEGLYKRYCICKEGVLGDQCEFDLNANATGLTYSTIGIASGLPTFAAAKAMCASQQRTLLTRMTDSVRVALYNYNLAQDSSRVFFEIWLDDCNAQGICPVYRFYRTPPYKHEKVYKESFIGNSKIAVCEKARKKCPKQRFGKMCEKNCTCYNGGYCDDITGKCICPGYGNSDLYVITPSNDCGQKCGIDRYGYNCRFFCPCPGGLCNSANGQCSCSAGKFGRLCRHNITKDTNDTDSIIVNMQYSFTYDEATSLCHKRRQQLPTVVDKSTKLTLLNFLKSQWLDYTYLDIWLNDCDSFGKCKAVGLDKNFPQANSNRGYISRTTIANFHVVMCTDAGGFGYCSGLNGHSLKCHTQAKCFSVFGYEFCHCNPGYSKDGVNCIEIDECLSGSHTCSPGGTCENYPGSFFCHCGPGYRSAGPSCTNVDECAERTHTCHTHATCIDNSGGFSCQCNTGFSGDGRTCWDIDDCAPGSHLCHHDAICIDGIDSYQCQCRNGFRGNGTNCNDINECDTSSSTSLCHTKATCHNNKGSYSCSCDIGYQGDGKTCSVCQQFYYGKGCRKYSFCYNRGLSSPTDGQCTCIAGYTGRQCENSCPHGWYGLGCLQQCMCHNGGTCRNIDGHCFCTAGYTGRYCEQTLITINDFSRKRHITGFNLAAFDCSRRNGLQNGVWRKFIIQVPNCNYLQCPFRSDMKGNFYSGFKSGSKAGSMCLSWYPQSRSLISHTSLCIDPKRCSRWMKAATCQYPKNVIQPLICSCGPNWHGAFCERENVCHTRNPCKNGGTCVPSDDRVGFRCYCPPYSHGGLCERLDRECTVFNQLHSAASAVLYYYYISSPLGSNTVADMCKRRGAEPPVFIPRTHCQTFSGYFITATSQNQAICQRPLQICKGFGTLQVPKGHPFSNTVTFAEANRLCKQSNMLSIPWAFSKSVECASRLVLRMQKLYNLTPSQTPKIWWWQDRFRNEKRTILCWVYRSNEMIKGEHHDEYQTRNGTML